MAVPPVRSTRARGRRAALLLTPLLLLARLLAACGAAPETSSTPPEPADAASADTGETDTDGTGTATEATEAEAAAMGPPAGGSTSGSTSALPRGTPEQPAVAMQSALLDSGGALAEGKPVPDFSYTMPDGTTYKLSDLRGKKVLINFWATWCPPCKAEMPDIQEAFTLYGEDDFAVVAVSQDVETTMIEPFALQMGLTFPLVADANMDIGRAYGVRGMPSSYFVNSDGTLYARTVGMVSFDLIEKRIGEMK